MEEKKKKRDKDFERFLKEEFEYNPDTSDVLIERQSKEERRKKRKI